MYLNDRPRNDEDAQGGKFQYRQSLRHCEDCHSEHKTFLFVPLQAEAN